MPFYQHYLRPLLFQLDPEKIHDLTLGVLKHPWTTAWMRPWTCCPSLQRPISLWGLKFRNPIGLAAGLDKNGVAAAAWENIGFGFMEIGTVTPLPQEGNPKPRLFRLPVEKGLINRMGFPNEGAASIAHRLEVLKKTGCWPHIPLGINLGKNKSTPLEAAAQDYLTLFEALQDEGDFFVVNVSSPNTPGLRSLQQKETLRSVLAPLRQANEKSSEKPLLLKIAPDLQENEIDDILEVALEQKISGIVATNTSLDHAAVSLKEQGGLSGSPMRERSTRIIRFIHSQTQGKLPIVGVGGIETAADAQEKLDAGASLLEVYTGLIYQGPFMVRRICRALKTKP